MASRAGRSLLVEVKGFPSIGYRDPRRAGEVKRTNPTLQAKHWFADALLKVVRMQNANPRAEVAMCLPTSPRYDSLVAETFRALQRSGIGVFFVNPSGEVTIRLEAQRVRQAGVQ